MEDELGSLPSAKRPKTSHERTQRSCENSQSGGRMFLSSMSRSVTPPISRATKIQYKPIEGSELSRTQSRPIPSPIQLTYIRGFPESLGNNVDTVKLPEILGDPLIKECWQFNYLFDVDFLMSQFDVDVRNLLQVKVVHGSWKRESPNRMHIDEACRRYPNVEAIVAYMPEPFGTHHSKMMILVRHDDLAQVVIHTANMIPGDWANMCQAVWRSPLLPILSNEKENNDSIKKAGIGTGHRFKRDLLAYLGAYGNKKTGPLVKQLEKHDFSTIRGALIASVPSRQEIATMDSEKQSIWGWPALKDALCHVPLESERESDSQKVKPHIVIQVSSVATLGQTDKWLKETFFSSLSSVSSPKDKSLDSTKFSIIFPTPEEIRQSLNGYRSGGSIHMKLQSSTQQRQLEYLRPYLCRWAGVANKHTGDTQGSRAPELTQVMRSNTDKLRIREAGRRRAAPHIKTYVRFSDADMTKIDWALVTSANLSTQAWGAAANAKQEVRICSWEIGVLIWPDLYTDQADDVNETSRGETDGNITKKIGMVPSFKCDIPSNSEHLLGTGLSSTLVGFRMPYDLPLTPYSSRDTPWCATSVHSQPDCLGQTWEGP